jgi:hypothetical protein
VLDLQVGKIPVAFRTDDHGNSFGEMRQVDPSFGPLHDHATVAELLGLKASDLVADWPIQTVSTDLYFAIVARSPGQGAGSGDLNRPTDRTELRTYRWLSMVVNREPASDIATDVGGRMPRRSFSIARNRESGFVLPR